MTLHCLHVAFKSELQCTALRMTGARRRRLMGGSGEAAAPEIERRKPLEMHSKLLKPAPERRRATCRCARREPPESFPRAPRGE
eukprot:8231218-Alexandrium_andersonii.AAC.1